MTVELLKAPTKDKVEGQPESPYLRASQEWDDRPGRSTVQAKNWRLACFMSTCIGVILACANLYQVTARKVVPYVITVNGETGAPKVIGELGESDYQPQMNEIRYFLTQLVRYLRAVPADPVVVKQNWLTAYQFLTPQAANALNSRTAEEADAPLKKLGERTVTVQPISASSIGQSQSYQLRWAEEVFDKHGSRLDVYNMSGIFVVEIKPPKEESVLSSNPLGIYVKDFQWSREL